MSGRSSKQSVVASKGEKAAPEQEVRKAEVSPEEKKAVVKAEKKGLPKAGGNGSASLLALGALLASGGLLAHRIVH